MAIDPLSPIAPARIRALLLPVGRIKRSRFMTFVDLLQPQCLVRLGDISPDPRPDRNMFSPLAFPNGTLLYDLSTSFPPPTQTFLSPFEQFREPLLLIGIADAAEYVWDESRSRDDAHHDSVLQSSENDTSDIYHAIEDLREQFPKVYLHSMLMFDCPSQSRPAWVPGEAILVPPQNELKTTTIKTVMCDITRVLLAEMTTLARSIHALPTVKSPAPHQVDDSSPWANVERNNPQSARRNSQITSGLRPGSPATASQMESWRMSMPTQLPSSSHAGPGGVEDSRTPSPTTQGARTPPTTFDEIPGINATSGPSRGNSLASKPQARDISTDRVSIHGFGSGGVTERARNKGKGRVGIIIGTLYLCTGQWPEALRELSEGAAKARMFSDHLWHAKALENILVCLLLFAWAGMDFQIPPMCYPLSDKTPSTKSPTHTPSSSVADVTSVPTPPPVSHDVALESLNKLIPDLINMILQIYNRASNFAGESLPPLAHSECVIRFSKLLTAMNLSAGYLDEDALQHLVVGTPIRQKPRLSVPRLSVNPTRNDIAALVFRAMPETGEAAGMSPIERVMVLAGIASILSALGLHRKKAIIMKEFVTSLIPGLVQARKVGAAEMGVHPAAGLAALNMASGSAYGAGPQNIGDGESDEGIDVFLELLGRIYGIPELRTSFSKSKDLAIGSRRNVGEERDTSHTVQDIFASSSLRSFGNPYLKIDILRMCINFCEALPDFNGVLHFTALLLRVAGPGTAPKPNSTEVIVSLSREEQVRLATNISRTVSAANKLGLTNVETEYWDDFLVRELYLLEEPSNLRLTQHRPSELKTMVAAKEGPFIHNPFLKKPDARATERVLVANQEYKFVIALQNPYDFEVELDSIKIAAKGVDFTAHEQFVLLGPYRTQKFPMVGMAHSAGTLEITGCYVKIKGCRERFFHTFAHSWKPEKHSKVKTIGLKACLGFPSSRPASAVVTRPESSELVGPTLPQPASLTLNVIPDQPIVVVHDVSLPQSAIMVLEGERKRFFVTLQNTSPTTTVDFVHISFQDSATAALEAGTGDRDLPAAELHELEVQLARFPTFRWCKNDEEAIIIKPGGTRSFEIEVVGRPRLTDAIIQFDYASLGKRHSEIQDRFFTRQVSLPISITVNASVQLQRTEIVSLSSDFAWAKEIKRMQTDTEFLSSSILLNKDSPSFQTFLHEARLNGSEDSYCLLLLDLRNSWPNPLYVTLEVRPPPQSIEKQLPPSSPDSSWTRSYTIHDLIQPGHVIRTTLLLPKTYIANPHAAIPSLNPANQRQFVVSTSKISPEAEQASRENFWFREALLSMIRGTWSEEPPIAVSGGKSPVQSGSNTQHKSHGDLDLRSLRFTPRMVEAMKQDDVSISMCILPDPTKPPSPEELICHLSPSTFSVPIDTFLTLQTKIYNRSPSPISPILRLQPYLSNLPHTLALDLDKRFSWTGVLQKKVPVIGPGESVESEIGVVVLCKGVFEIGAVVEECEIWNDGDDDNDDGWVDGNRREAGGERKKKRGRSISDILLQAEILGEPALRSWSLREPCVIIARAAET